MKGLTTLLGMLLGFGSAFFVIYSTGVKTSVFFDVNGLVMVVLGTVAAIFLSFNFTQIKRILGISSQIFIRSEDSLKYSATVLLNYSKSTKELGFGKADATGVHPFINDCVLLLNDDYDVAKAREILTQRIRSFAEQEYNDTNLLKSMAKYPPAFGMLGTVIGLIALMAKIGEGLDPDQVGLYMAIALTTTMYGVALANLLFKPLADNLHMRSVRNMKKRQMAMEAALLLKDNVSLVVIQDTINSFLSPSDNVDIFSQGVKSVA